MERDVTKLSVVIPTLNAQQVLPSTLESLMEGVFAGVIGDLVIVDGGSNDATINMAKEVGATLLETKPSRGGQIFAGVFACKYDWVLILHADSRLSQGWAELIPTASDPERPIILNCNLMQLGLLHGGWRNGQTYDLKFSRCLTEIRAS